MSTGRARAATTLAGLLLSLAACNGDEPDVSVGSTVPGSGAPTTTVSGPTSTATSTTAPQPTGPTTTLPTVPPVGDLAVLDIMADDDGTLGVDAALALFAAGYAPVPGVEPAPTALVDGTPVLRTLLGRLDELSEPQRLAVAALTDQPGLALADVPDDPRLDKSVDTILFAKGVFTALLGRELRAEVELTVAPLPYANADGTTNFSTSGSFATALPFAVADATTYDECRIRINTDAPVDATLGFDDPAFASTVAAAVFHCMQYGLVGAGADVPMWVMEGAAAFAGEDYSRGSVRSADWWARWIGEPLRPLEERTFDASGFFAMLKGYADVYKLTDIFLGDADPISLVRRLERTGAFDRWGTQYATEPSWGGDYTVGGFGAPTTPAPALPVTLTVDGGPVTLTSPGPLLVGAGYRVTVPGEILVVTTDPGDNGGLRFADGTEAAFEGASQAYCLTPGGCVCPGASPDQGGSAAQVASADLFIGVGPSPGGGPTLAARTLTQWCNEVLLPAPPTDALDQCLAQRWTSSGYEAPDTPGVRLEVTGGLGAVLDLRPDRTVTVDMNATSPVVFTSQDASGVITTTSLEYRGVGSGTWSAADGVIAVNGIDATSFTVRLRIDLPGGQLSDVTLPATDTRLAGFAGLLGTGRYVCSAVSMTLTRVAPNVGGDAGFSFTPG